MISPKLPSVRELARELRELYKADVAEYFALELRGTRYPNPANFEWCVAITSGAPEGPQFGSEYIPGEHESFDATAAARRLLSDARGSMKGMK